MTNFISCAVTYNFRGKYLYPWSVLLSFKIPYLIATSVSQTFVRYVLDMRITRKQ